LGRPGLGTDQRYPTLLQGREVNAEMLLILGIILLVIAIAGGAIVHPVIFALAIVALVLFFMHHSGGRTAY
jgi:hypothetical protein